MEERLTAAGGDLAAEVRAGVATVTLNRPSALNAVTLDMVRGLAQWLDGWEDDDEVHTIVLRGAGEKAFCAGGDLRALYDFVKGGNDALDFFVDEYALDYRIHTYPKPIVAVIDGIVMGGGMGLAQGASLRIAGDRTKLAMPETAIGLFPDVGGSFFLSRTPGKLGTYLGLVGPTLRAADAIYCGLADLHIGRRSPARARAGNAASRDRRALRPRFGRCHRGVPRTRAAPRAARVGRAHARGARQALAHDARGDARAAEARRHDVARRLLPHGARAHPRMLRAGRFRRGHPRAHRGQGHEPEMAAAFFDRTLLRGALGARGASTGRA
jgi:enoyl-CoA hydratase/carnithine racemase